MTDDVSLLEAQQEIHQLIAQQAPLDQVLDAIAHWLGLQLPGAVVAFMRFDPARCSLSLLSSPRFSADFTAQLQDVPVGLAQASFGTAAYLRRQVITADIQTDSRWANWRSAALTEGLRACWSHPVITTQGELLGTFGTYYRQPTTPSERSKRRLRQASALIALAVIKDRDSRRHRTLAEWHRSLFDNHPDGVYEFDLKGHFLRGNAALTRITGHAAQDLVGRHFSELIAPDYRQLTQSAFAAARSGASSQYETQGLHADGHHVHLAITNFPVTVEGEIVGVYGICHDITQRKQQEAELHLLKRGIEASPNGVIMTEANQADLPIVYANQAFCELTGYRLDEVLGQNCRFLQGPETDPAILATLRHALATRTEAQVVLRNYRKDGTPFWNRLAISPVVDPAGHCTHFIGTQQDITRERDQEAQLVYQANHDLLTGLPNRTALERRLAQDVDISRQQQRLMAVLYLDLDGFKAINDGMGHHIGNRLLVAIADRLTPLLGPHETLARLSGDEFVFLLPTLTRYEEVDQAAERILAAFERAFQIDGHALHISASIGIACGDEASPHALLQHADLALEAAKRQGRNTWQWYRGEGAEVTNEQVLMRHDLQIALRDQQFELYYQPVVDALSGRMVSAEALIRWHHPRHGLLSPGCFIPVAEQTGQIIALGRWVLWQACQTQAALLAKDERVVPVAVNISSLQFRRDGFLAEVQAILEETGLPAALLELEVTESILLEGAEQAIAMVGTLREMGVTVTIDDFGTGFSSLGYLRDLPIHKVKLDRAFICDILSSRRNAAIAQGIITMAHHMDLLVVAEGIETRAQQDDLVRRDCDLLQGYRFARPMPLEALRALPETLPPAAAPCAGQAPATDTSGG